MKQPANAGVKPQKGIGANRLPQRHNAEARGFDTPPYDWLQKPPMANAAVASAPMHPSLRYFSKF